MYKFTLASLENYDDFFKIKTEDNSVYWSGFDSAPNYDSFKEYYIKELARDDRTIVFLYINNEVAGYIAIDLILGNPEIEIGYGALKAFSGQGLGRKLIEYSIKYSKEKILESDHMIAWIAEDNIASIKSVLGNGFSKTEEFEYRDFKQEEDKVKFHKYILNLK